LFTVPDLVSVPLIGELWGKVIERYPDVDERRLVPELVRDQIGVMVNDVIAETRARLAEARVETVDDVRSAGRALAGFSPGMAEEERRLKAFLYERMYQAAPVRAVAAETRKVVAGLFAAYRADPTLLPPEWQAQWGHEVAMLRTIGDFIAGMTDRYAITQYRQHVGPVELAEDYS
jgi:dGTPase